MKQTIILSAALLLLGSNLLAQKTFKKAFSGTAQKVNILLQRSNVSIQGHAGNELIIEPDQALTLTPIPERAKGLKPLYNTASDNTGLGLEVEEVSGVMTIRKATFQKINYVIKVPSKADVRIEVGDWEQNDLSLKDLSGEIEITGKSSDIKLQNITGPVVANTVNGSIEVTISRLEQSKPTHISTVNGFIDVSLPADSKANVNLSTINGEIYSDADIKFPNKDDKGLPALQRNTTNGKINGGGVELTFKTINGEIYLRKK
jgi:DUF4097 and DUF4098 domain-containing protein YvlB